MTGKKGDFSSPFEKISAQEHDQRTGATVDKDNEEWRPGAPCVDVTAIYAHPRTTGIQRVVRDIVGDGKSLKLMRYSPEHDSYVHVSELPTLKPRQEHPFFGALRRALKESGYKLWLRFGSFAERANLGRFYNSARRVASGIYSSFLSDTTLSSFRESRFEEAVELHPEDALWLLDIPKSEKHLRFVKSLAEARRCKLGLYLYDMIPVDFPGMIGGAAAEEIKQEYVNYLELVPLSSSVFFLSQHTRTRYLAFAEENGVTPPQNERVIYPPLDFSRYEALSQNLHKSSTSELATYTANPSPATRILCVSPLNQRKNVKVVLRAVTELLEQGENILFLLVAPTLSAADPETVALSKFLKRRFPHNFLIVNQISDDELVACYRKTDILAMPSVVEGFGLPIVEGLYFGCHVVVSDQSSFVELGQLWPISLLTPHDHGAWCSQFRSLLGKEPPGSQVQNDLPTPEQFRDAMAEL